jgi:hypothetical protein
VGLDDVKIGNIVLHGRYVGAFAGSVAQANALLTGFATGAPWSALAAFLSTTTLLAQVLIRDINTPHNAYIAPTGPGSYGTSASPSLPNEVSLVGTKRTGQTGPQARGRVYLPGWATNALGTGNTVAAAAVTAYQNWLNTFASVMLAEGYTHCLALPARAAYTGSTGTTHDARTKQTLDVTSMLVRDNHWDTQRRRGLR